MEPDPDDGIWAENEAALRAFLAVASQWRDGGLDYAGARAGFELAGLDVDPALWGEVRVIEAGAREAIAEERERRER